MVLSYPVSMVLISIFIILLFFRCLCDCCGYKLDDEPIYNTLSTTKTPKKTSNSDSNRLEYMTII